MFRSEEYMEWIRHQPCIVCGITPCDPHHEDVLKSGGMSIKGHDSQCLPLCRDHHRSRDDINMGRDAFENKYCVDLKLEIIKHLTRFMERRMT